MAMDTATGEEAVATRLDPAGERTDTQPPCPDQ
jgi:hypothetical protein